jgi:hypothetical protein
VLADCLEDEVDRLGGRRFDCLPVMAEYLPMLRPAVDRGEVRADTPAVRFTMHMMSGAFAAHTLIDAQPPTHYFLLAYIDAVTLPALGAPTA